MVLISSKKYACETCIKGHRSSTCKHTDRPLYEIKKKGRPVTQCEHCRELRKTKQVHVKCICEVKTETTTAPQPSSNGKKGTKIPQCAAFPNGLPQELEATITPQFQEGFPSDSLHGVKEQNSCSCKSGGSCVCCTLRYSSRNPPNETYVGPQQAACDEPPNAVAQPQVRLSMSHILARVKELRPVLPRPSSSNAPEDGPIHDLSSGLPHTHPTRHHVHDNVMFSPYGRAHDRTHDHPLGFEKLYPPMTPANQSPIKGENPYDHAMLDSQVSQPQPLQGNSFPLGNLPFMPACGCSGNGSEPKAMNIPNVDINGVPNVCLECSYFIPPPSGAAQKHPNQRLAIDEWLRQVPTPQNNLNNAAFQQGIMQQEYPSSAEKPHLDHCSDSAICAWDKSALLTRFNQPCGSSDDGHTQASTPEYCGNHCSCPPQSCKCQESSFFSNGDMYNSAPTMNRRASGSDQRFNQLQMSQGMSRSDTHLVLPELYQTRPFSTPLQKGLGPLRPSTSNMNDLPYSVSMSALDVAREMECMGNSQSVVQALLDFPIGSNTSMTTPSIAMPWLTGNDIGGNLSVPNMYPYAMSSSGTDGTSSYDDLSMTLRTPL